MSEQRNSYDNDDLVQVCQEIEGFFATEEATRQDAKKLRQDEVKKAKNRAKELGIPDDILVAALAERKLDRTTDARRRKIVGKVKQDHLELYEESSGQFSWFKPEGKQLSRTQTIIDERRAQIDKVTAEEQAEGEQVLDDLTKGQTVN